MNIKDMFLRFWKSDNDKISIVRDVVVALLAVLIILMVLWGYTGQWFSAPMVAIESGSMEHPNPPFGRLGTIDAGDMVLVQRVWQRSDVIPHGGTIEGAQAENGHQTYGSYGDVIIYKPLGRTDVSQIIHRAMCWVDVYTNNGQTTYTIGDYGIYNATSLTIPALGLYNRDPGWTHSGFLTKGDNNDVIDEITDICPQPVKVEWISGKARGEIPWLGTINLFFEDLLHGRNTVRNVHQDSLICLGIVIAVLISIPIILDVYEYLKKKKQNPA
ncbi:MAG: S26 family signal peptidase [Candidatus Thermoplasmatota archaeon]|nr:S26 family signal peptidase [Candidatus Thermoplasmatota archaeon]